MRKRKVKPIFKEAYIQVTAVVAFSIVLTNLFVKPVQVSGTSMYPTLQDNEKGITNILKVKLNKVERFDIVVIYSDSLNEYLIKRVVGLPGETVQYKNDTLYIDGKKVKESFLNKEYKSSYDVFTEDTDELTLGNDEYYCVGDNRPDSLDSRFLGPFKKSQLVSDGFVGR